MSCVTQGGSVKKQSCLSYGATAVHKVNDRVVVLYTSFSYSQEGARTTKDSQQGHFADAAKLCPPPHLQFLVCHGEGNGQEVRQHRHGVGDVHHLSDVRETNKTKQNKNATKCEKKNQKET